MHITRFSAGSHGCCNVAGNNLHRCDARKYDKFVRAVFTGAGGFPVQVRDRLRSIAKHSAYFEQNSVIGACGYRTILNDLRNDAAACQINRAGILHEYGRQHFVSEIKRGVFIRCGACAIQ